MLKYSKVIFFIIILIIFSASVIHLYTFESIVNQMMQEVSSSIVSGDNDYNEAVDLVNDKNYSETRNKAISAGNNFNYSLLRLSSVNKNFTSDT